MKHPLYYIALLMLTLLGTSSYTHAQMIVSDETQTAATATPQQAGNDNIHIFADPRLALLIEKHRGMQYGGIRRMRGYRVQIYSGNDRNEAISRKVDFMRRYPKVKTYMVYMQPQYRVRVGNFATREDALDIYREAIAIYGAAMIVPENVVINYFDDDSDD